MWVRRRVINRRNHPAVITIFLCGVSPIPSHEYEWFMFSFYANSLVLPHLVSPSKNMFPLSHIHYILTKWFLPISFHIRSFGTNSADSKCLLELTILCFVIMIIIQ